MSTRWFFTSVAVLLITISASCSRTGPGLYPVHGTVTYKGQPAEGAIVYFHLQRGSPGSPPGLIPTAVVDSSGKFALGSGDLGSRCACRQVRGPGPVARRIRLARQGGRGECQDQRHEDSREDQSPQYEARPHSQRPAQGSLHGANRPLLTAEVKAERNEPAFVRSAGWSLSRRREEGTPRIQGHRGSRLSGLVSSRRQ